MLDPDPLIAAVQKAGCNRMRWTDLAAVAAGLDRDEFVDDDGEVDDEKVAAWADRHLPARVGPTWAVAQLIVGAAGKSVVVWEDPIVTADGVTSIGTAGIMVRARLSDLVDGYPDDLEPPPAA